MMCILMYSLPYILWIVLMIYSLAGGDDEAIEFRKFLAIICWLSSLITALVLGLCASFLKYYQTTSGTESDE